jgi:hypothetical protein
MADMLKNPIAAWAIALFVPCGLGYLFWIHNTSTVLKEYLEDESANPVIDVVICCVPLGMFYVMYTFGQRVYAAQQKAGLADAEDKSVVMAAACLCCAANVWMVQAELSKVIDPDAV